MSGKSDKGGRALGFLIMVAIGFLLVGGYALAGRYLSAHSKQFAKGDYLDLNPYVTAHQELPAGTFGKVSVRWVFGRFASEEESVSNWGISFSAGTKQYYLAVLDDLSTIAIAANDEGEIQRLDRLYEAFDAAEDVYAISAQEFEGKVEKLTNRKLTEYYDSALQTSGLMRDPSFTVTYLTLNTAAIPGRNILLYFVLPAAALVIFLVVRAKAKKRRLAAQAQSAQPIQDEGGSSVQ